MSVMGSKYVLPSLEDTQPFGAKVHPVNSGETRMVDDDGNGEEDRDDDAEALTSLGEQVVQRAASIRARSQLRLWARLNDGDVLADKAVPERRTSAPNVNCPKTLQQEIAAIRIRLRDGNRWVVLPSSRAVKRWDVVTFCALIITAVVTPVESSFLPQPQDDALFVLNRIIDMIFIGDLILQFFMGYYDTTRGNILIKNRHLIAKHYIKSWFLIDLVSSVPVDLLSALVASDDLRWLKLVRVLRLLKLARVWRLKRMHARWEIYAVFTMSYATLGIYKLAAMLIIFAHWSACLWGLAASPDIIGKASWSWIKERRLLLRDGDGRPLFDRGSALQTYTVSLYYSIYTMTGIGYGDVVPSTHHECAVAVFLMAVSAVFWAFMIGSFCSIVSSMNAQESQYRQRMDELNVMMADRKFPSELKTRCRLFLINSKQHQRAASYHSLENLFSFSLRGDVAAVINEPWITNVWYLKPASKEFIIELSQSLTSIMFAPMEPIDISYSLFILQSGIVARRGRILSKGSLWGAEFIMSDVSLIDRTIGAALSYVLVTCISREDFFGILEDPLFANERAMIASANRFYALKMRLVKLAASFRKRQHSMLTGSYKPVGRALTPKMLASSGRRWFREKGTGGSTHSFDGSLEQPPPYINNRVSSRRDSATSDIPATMTDESIEETLDSVKRIETSQCRLESVVMDIAKCVEAIQRQQNFRSAGNLQRGARRDFARPDTFLRLKAHAQPDPEDFRERVRRASLSSRGSQDSEHDAQPASRRRSSTLI